MSFALPWQLVGHNGCLPKPYRSCQYGDTPYVEMAAVQVTCPEADAFLRAHEENALLMEIEEELSQLGVEEEPTPPPIDPADMPVCHATVEWSWGGETLTLPADAYGPIGSSNVLYLAGFRPEFSEGVPPTMPAEVSRYPIQSEGARGRASGGPREEYPIPDPGVILARRDTPVQRGGVPEGSAPLVLAAAALALSSLITAARASRDRRSPPDLL